MPSAISATSIIAILFILFLLSFSLFLTLFLPHIPMGRSRQINWEPIKALYLSGKSAREISIIFDIHPSVIGNKASQDGWGTLRKALRKSPLPNGQPASASIPKNQDLPKPAPAEIGFELKIPNSKSEKVNDSVKDEPNDAFSRALRLRTSDEFRNRVIAQADKALVTLEKSVVSTVYETDRFAEALTKVERIGARAYGYDRESDHPIINIGILGSGSEYDPI
jgi:hypothetical protein